MNHPEPPQQVGSELETEGNHMLSITVMKLIHGVLQVKGKLTIVSDNEWYAKLLAKQFGDGLSESFRSVNVEDHSLHEFYKHKGITVLEGSPNASVGHGVCVSSYFDGLWKSGAGTQIHGAQKTRRFILYLEPIKHDKLKRKTTSEVEKPQPKKKTKKKKRNKNKNKE